MSGNTRELRVTGRGRLQVPPDLTRVYVTLEKIWPTYDETLRRSSEETEQIRDLLQGFGFEAEELKTLEYRVDTEYEGYEENGAYRRRFVGYRCIHRMKVEFPSDGERLGKLLNALAVSPAEPEFSIGYAVKDTETARNRLLGLAVADAKRKAELLAAAAGVSLREIRAVDYSWTSEELEIRTMNASPTGRLLMKSQTEESFDMAIQPDDIDVTDTVTVIWSIQ